MNISIIIPAFDEEFRIAPTLRSVASLLEGYGKAFEIIVVDDGSRDRTASVVDEARKDIGNLLLISGGANRGKGHAVRRGMLSARGRVRLMCDADGSIPASEMPKLLEPILSGQVDVAIGSRYVKGSSTENNPPAWRHLWSRFANMVVRATLLPGVKDTQCGFKAFSARAAEAVFSQARINGWAFDLEVLSLVRRYGYALTEVAINWSDDSRSRVEPVQDFLRVVRDWAKIYRNLHSGVYTFAENGVSAAGGKKP